MNDKNYDFAFSEYYTREYYHSFSHSTQKNQKERKYEDEDRTINGYDRSVITNVFLREWAPKIWEQSKYDGESWKPPRGIETADMLTLFAIGENRKLA